MSLDLIRLKGYHMYRKIYGFKNQGRCSSTRCGIRGYSYQNTLTMYRIKAPATWCGIRAIQLYRRTSSNGLLWNPVSVKLFSTTSIHHLQALFPRKETEKILKTHPAWPHPGYTLDEMVAVSPSHRQPQGLGDLLAWKTVRFARFWMDVVTGIGPEQQVDKKKPTTSIIAQQPLTESQWVSGSLIDEAW